MLDICVHAGRKKHFQYYLILYSCQMRYNLKNKLSLRSRDCREPAISLHSYTVPLFQWSNRLLPVMRDPGSNHREVLMWNRDSPVSVVLLHWWPRRDWSLWPHLRQASSPTVTRPSCRQCDNPIWSHTALLSRFQSHCRSFFWLNWYSRLLGGSLVESLQSLCIHTQFHWSSGPPLCFPSWGTWVQTPGGYFCETRIRLLALSCYKMWFKLSGGLYLNLFYN